MNASELLQEVTERSDSSVGNRTSGGDQDRRMGYGLWPRDLGIEEDYGE